VWGARWPCVGEAGERELVRGSSRRAGSPRRRGHPELHIADVAGKRHPRTVGSPGGGILGEFVDPCNVRPSRSYPAPLSAAKWSQ